MTAHVASQPAREPAAAITPLLRTVLLCDLVESTALVERLGDSRVAQLLQRHDQQLVRLLTEHNGQLIDKSDGVLALFERPIQALAFAMDYQRGLRELGQSAGETLQARIGIHVGDVMTWTHTPEEVLAGAKPVEVEGLAKPVAARLMGLALPGQILLSGMAQNFAHRAQAELGDRAGTLQWRFHGRYRFKGVPAPMLVHEAGETGFAPLKPPPSGAKAWRELPFWRKPSVLAVEAMLVIALAGFGIYSTLRSPPAIAFAERDWVVVADFNNRTGETLYDDALDSALRVGLEQSRYVNVLSDLQVEQALQRMQRTAQTLDRQTGSELALREGAKALVLPTIAEVGGRPRISVEVVDPNSGVTVYTRMADASGSGGVVAALDDVLTDMRTDLGESLSSIQKNNVPLEKATTENLEALRAYSLGLKAKSEGRTADAVALFQQAIQRDPEFAMAYLRLGFIMYSDNNLSETERYLHIAESKRTHLTAREVLTLDAGLAIFVSPDEMLRRWKLMADMFPDEHRAYYTYSFFSHLYTQDYESAFGFIGPALDTRNPYQGNAYYLLGVIQLQRDHVAEALEAFKRAQSLGVSGFLRHYADAYAAQRNFAEADAILRNLNSQFSGNILEERVSDVTYPIDKGDWQGAVTAAAALVEQAQDLPNKTKWAYQLLQLALRSYSGDQKVVSDAEQFIDNQVTELAGASSLDRQHLMFNLLAAGWIAANSGAHHLAETVLANSADAVEIEKYQANADMRLAVRAEIALSEGRAESAIELLEPRCRAKNELFFLHAILMRAYAANGNYPSALSEADWMQTHRGRAYGEYNSFNVWQPVNVLESNLSLLAAMHYADKVGDKKKRDASKATLHAVWPNASQSEVAGHWARKNTKLL